MGQRLAAFGDLPSHFVTTLIGETTSYRIRYKYNSRMAAWYCDLYAADGTLLVAGRRLSPYGRLWSDFEFEGKPDVDFITVMGPSGYQQVDLGDTLYIAWFTQAELVALAESISAGETV